MSITDEGEYGIKQIMFLECVWGEGFLSPGGVEEIDLVVDGLDLRGKTILDIGCGCGGAAFHLIRQHGAHHVTGIDVEPLVIERARELAERYGLSDQAEFFTVEPGPLSLTDNSMDVIFSKDAFLHIPDKEALMRDCARVLKPGGVIAASDWMRKDDNPPSAQMLDYIQSEGLDMHMGSLERYHHALDKAGFEDISLLDRNEWYHRKAMDEVAELKGPLREKIVELVGEDDADHVTEIWEKLIGVLALGEHRPGHFRARLGKA
ncbi:MAG: methyltransferase domain-containing protein [Alphaproteobacteria bacterium]|nr:methyltransferase domain-containing protein [Alphaproteobacteria bacterium]